MVNAWFMRLDPPRVFGRKTLRGFRGTVMTRIERLILSIAMTSMMVFMVTLVATYLNLGLRADFVFQWAKAYIVAWPIAAATAYLVMPMSRRLTTRIVNRIDGAT